MSDRQPGLPANCQRLANRTLPAVLQDEAILSRVLSSFPALRAFYFSQGLYLRRPSSDAPCHKGRTFPKGIRLTGGRINTKDRILASCCFRNHNERVFDDLRIIQGPTAPILQLVGGSQTEVQNLESCPNPNFPGDSLIDMKQEDSQSLLSVSPHFFLGLSPPLAQSLRMLLGNTPSNHNFHAVSRPQHSSILTYKIQGHLRRMLIYFIMLVHD